MGNSLTVRPVGRRDVRRFIRFPWKVYQGNPNWVPPLIADQKKSLNTEVNPFFKHAEFQPFLCERKGELVGRIAAIIDQHYIEHHNERLGFFGFFEAIDDADVVRALFDAASEWLSEMGMERIRGPVNPTMSDSPGILLDAYDEPPVVLMAYNPPYYPTLIERAGFTKDKDLIAFYLHESTPLSDKVKRVAEIVRKRHNVTFRSADMRRFREELDLLKRIYNDSWERNWGFVPMTDEEIDFLAHDLKPVIRPELVIFAFVDHEPAGFSVTLPDVYQALHHLNGRLFPFGLFKLLWYMKRIDRVRVVFAGIAKKFRNRGLDAIFYYETYMRSVSSGFPSGEFSWILEDNYPMRNTLENMGATIYKHYRMYGKAL